MSRYYHTTPIYYVNAIPHVGHAYTTIAADALTRARRLCGHEVFLLTGTDEHGQNIERIARERGIPEQQHCDEIAAQFRSLFERLDVRFDDFIRTTEERHKRGVLALWKRLKAAVAPDGREAIYTGTYSGWYCPRCEAFKDEDELRQPGNVCPDHELPCEWTQEENFFFRLSAYSDWLRDQITSGRLLIEPPGRRNEVLAVVEQGLKDFSVSRARVKWGIPVPEQPDHVLYVWVDALSNYVTALGFADDAETYRRFWDEGGERLHLVGKDIIRFHCLYWPAILHAAGVKPPTRVFVQGHITKNGKKLSKTTGNVIDPEALVATYGPDAVRYFLLREGVYGHDWDFTDEAFVTRFNADLANDYGNLVSRALTMVQKYCDGKLPPRPTDTAGARTSVTAGPPPALAVDRLESRYQYRDGQGKTELRTLAEGILASYGRLDFSGALAQISGELGQLNRRIAEFQPWEKAKSPASRVELDAFIYRVLEPLRVMTLLLSPVIPRATAKALRMLGAPADPGPMDLEWGRLEPGTPIGPIEPLFPRLEKARPSPASAPSAKPSKPSSKESNVSDTQPMPAAAVPAPATSPQQVSIDDFAKIDLRVARITAAERIEGANKLLKLQIDLGGEARQIVSGIADAYEPEQLVGRQIVVVANLKPAKLRGVESQGMLLAASVDGKAVLCGFEQAVEPGTKVK